jgi:hypothetical protein
MWWTTPMPEAFRSQQGTVGSWSTNAPDDFGWSDSDAWLLPLSLLLAHDKRPLQDDVSAHGGHGRAAQ